MYIICKSSMKPRTLNYIFADHTLRTTVVGRYDALTLTSVNQSFRVTRELGIQERSG